MTIPLTSPLESDCYHALARYVPDIATVLDVGAAEGTMLMYFRDTGLFQQAKHVFIDCMVENEALYQKIGTAFDSDYVIGAMGEKTGTVDIRLDRSPYLTQRADHVQTGFETLGVRQVPSYRLDQLAQERGWKSPFLLRMDVQGAEQFVLAGADGLVPDMPMVTIEISFFAAPDSTAQVWAWLERHGYVPYAVINPDFSSLVHRMTSIYLIGVKRGLLPDNQEAMIAALAQMQAHNAPITINALAHAATRLQEMFQHAHQHT